jgi:hypothetical protein
MGIIARNILLFGLVTILSNGLDLSNKIIPTRKTSLQSTVAPKHLLTKRSEMSKLNSRMAYLCSDDVVRTNPEDRQTHASIPSMDLSCRLVLG